MYTCSITTCGRKFKGRNGRSNKYCSPECYNAAQRNGDYKTGRKSLPCKGCTKPIFDIYEKDKDGNFRTEYFCRDCHLENLAKLRGNCDHCQNPIPAGKSGNKYCSDECNYEAKRAPPRYCTECNAYYTPISLVKTPSGELKYFSCDRQMQCSSECAKKAQFNENRNKKISEAHKGDKHWNYKGGTSEYRGENWEEQRLLALQRDNYRCVECGIEDDKENTLRVHHKIPYHCYIDYIEANDLDNLEALCSKCHGSLHGLLSKFDLPYVKGADRPGTPKGERVGTSRHTDAEVEMVVEDLNKGIPPIEVSKKYNMLLTHVSGIGNGRTRLHATGGRLNGYKKSPAKGSRIAKAVLTEDSARKIKRLLSKGVDDRIIAGKFEVHVNTIRAIKYGKTWKHVSANQTN